jgi:hypothetical protein
MTKQRDTHKVGIPSKPRGQQTGYAGNPDQNREEMDETPALRGRRKSANKMFADKSSQHVGSDSTKPRTNQPSTPAMTPSTPKGQSTAERSFKQRLAKKRKS